MPMSLDNGRAAFGLRHLAALPGARRESGQRPRVGVFALLVAWRRTDTGQAAGRGRVDLARRSARAHERGWRLLGARVANLRANPRNSKELEQVSACVAFKNRRVPRE